jgi:ketosteroid isomerase-like protein
MLAGGGRMEGATTQDNIEIVREGYAHFNRGDIDWMVEQMWPEISWTDSTEVPGAKTYRGVDEVRPYLQSFGRVWEEARFEPQEVKSNGDKVLAVVHFVARGRHSGADVNAKLSHLYVMRDGKCRSCVTYFDHEAARRDFEAG